MKVPYPMVAALSYHERCEQMSYAIAVANEREYPRLQQTPIDDTPGRVIVLACYGPSLADTWETIRDAQRAGAPVISMSGATRFLADRGVTADYHVDMDPRKHKAKHLDPPVPGVNYLMASVCPPATWELLKYQKVTLWHTYSGKDPATGQTTHQWVGQHDPGSIVIHGGSTIGLTALHIAGVMGHRRIEVHGMDGSFADATRTSRHAGPHFGHQQQDMITWDAEGVTYHTSKIMSNAVAETLSAIKHFPMFTIFHGRGLTQALVREANLPTACTAEQTEKAAAIRAMQIVVNDLRLWDGGNVTSLWGHMLSQPDAPAWLSDVLQIVRDSEGRRSQARYNTGSVGLETALLLRALSAHFKPKIIIEVGTFIGTSTMALQASEHLYTCDRDNDCLPSDRSRTCFPYTRATDMFTQLVQQKVKADLVFLDGRLKSNTDVPLLMKLTHDKTVFVFDDFANGQKGMANFKILAPFLANHGLLQPYDVFRGRSTLAAMLPFEKQ